MRALQTRRWTRKEYDRLVDQGVLTPSDKVELIEGEIVPMAPQNARHAVAQRLGQDLLPKAFDAGSDVRPALPLAVSDDSEPEPDLAVVRGSPRDVVRAHPTTAVLVVEIADSSLDFDRRQKARLYARSGVPEYWIENLRDRVLEVLRDPRADAESAETRYQIRLVRRAGDVVSPLAAPEARLAVDDLFP